MKKLIVSLAVCLLALALPALAELRVVTTSFPCYDLARAALGGDSEVTMLLKPGTEAHTYDPSPADILAIGEADLFIYIGGESDVWADGILASFSGDGPAVLKLMDTVEPLEEAEDDAAHAGHHDGTAAFDEHIWTSPRNALRMAEAAGEALAAAAPERAEEIRANTQAYMGEISAIDAELTALVDGAARRRLIFADRFPFIYLTHDYGLTFEAAFPSCTAQTEPSAKVVVELIEAVVSEKIPCVYVIELSNRAVADTIAAETGAAILELHSMQTVTLEQFQAGDTWVTIMRRNLDALREGLY